MGKTERMSGLDEGVYIGTYLVPVVYTNLD